MTTIHTISFRRAVAVVGAAVALAWGGAAQAHCDTLDGPVVNDARRALDNGNVNLVLGWVRAADEPEVRGAFQRASAVRKGDAAAKELADRSFFETLVRVHRAGEGAPYTGLKPAGQPEPAVAAADRAIATGQLEPVAKMLTQRVQHGLHEQYDAVAARRKYDPNDVAAARAYAGAYVQYVHYVERLHDAAATGGAHDAHAAPAAPATPAAHQH
jgi:hypothetical protein